MAKVAVAFSGGWDSTAIALMQLDADLVFFSYGQLYVQNELDAAYDFSRTFNRQIKIIQLDLHTDVKLRNLFFILYLHKMGYDIIYIGSRNILPLFDKYKDSNWLSLKLFGLLFGIKIRLPITGWVKSRVVKYVRFMYSGKIYNCYFNSNTPETCLCVNCKEMREIL